MSDKYVHMYGDSYRLANASAYKLTGKAYVSMCKLTGKANVSA